MLDSRSTVEVNALRARRKGWLKPLLHPIAGRHLPTHLRPAAVHAQAVAMPGGVREPDFSDLIQQIDQGPYHHDTEITPYFCGVQAFASMLQAVAAAEHEILLEAYIISGDKTGNEFLSALRAAVERGVLVYVLADAFGSSRTRRDFWHLLAQSGSQLRLFRRPRYAPLAWLPILDHRKLLVVDRRVAFTGGMNVADEYRTGAGSEPAWRDTHVRVSGTIAWECALLFDESWQAAGGDGLVFRDHPVAHATGATALLLDSRPGRGAQEVHSAVAAIIAAARQRLWISNAYFAPNRRIVAYLRQAAQCGVDVRLLLPRHSDIPLIRWASQGYYTELLEAGVRIYEYRPAVLHAKTLLVDECISMIGSTNFDFRSFEFNHECNVFSPDAELAEKLAEQFLLDLHASSEITITDWARAPWWRQLLSRAARLLAPIL